MITRLRHGHEHKYTKYSMPRYNRVYMCLYVISKT